MSVTLGMYDLACKAIYFTQRGGMVDYVVGLDDMDYIQFMNKYEDGPHGIQRQRCRGINLDGTESRFFAVAVSDCFSPPVTIVRADNEQDAEEMFIENSPAEWITDEVTLEEMGESVSYDGDGHPYDSSSIVLWPVVIRTIEADHSAFTG